MDDAIEAGEAYCADSADSTCIVFDKSGAIEKANGIDDNCDGVWIGDERCNGIDDDGDGLVDEDPGSCLHRFVFVPVCWKRDNCWDNALNTLEQQAQKYIDFFESKSLLTSCGQDSAGDFPWPQKVWYEIISPEDFGYPDNPAERLNDMGILRDSDTVVYIYSITKQEYEDNKSDYKAGTGTCDRINLRPIDDDPWLGEEVYLAHEFGHCIDLGNEYEIDTGRHNTVDAANGCDPNGSCCDHDHPTVNNLCLGNWARDVSNWSWFMYPNLPPTYCTAGTCSNDLGPCYIDGDYSGKDLCHPEEAEDEGRCIMSNLSAAGTVEGRRGWCGKCLTHWYNEDAAPKCTQTFAGVGTTKTITGRLYSSGDMFIDSTDVALGRSGLAGPLSNDSTRVEVFDNGVLMRTITPHFSQSATDEVYPFFLRIPVSGSQPVLLNFVSYVDDTPVAQVTSDGSPPVAVADDVTAECDSLGSGAALLDGSASYDPDGDTVYFDWESSNVALTDADTEMASGQFPLGTETVTLTVSDGTGSEDSIDVSVTVQDTTPPVIDTSTVTITTCLASGAVVEVLPSVTDTCTQAATIQVDGYIKSMNGVDVGLIPITDPNLILPIGDTVIRWDAVDEHGNQSSAEQVFTVEFVPPPERDALFISNGYYPQEQALRDHLAIDNDYDIDTLKDYQINGTTDLSGYELIILTGFAPNVSYAGINNIASS
ncbi:MAG: hypothetical protein GY854_04195, partial [Deltaproteobacteria bacterium]|nr:hypothetical protein [Deltaproteobacteria bacterium]